MGSITLLIRNAEILNGLGNEPQHGDVVVSGDKISAIGNFPNLRADVVLDAQGAWLAPGFIDIHSHADRYHSLWDDPAQGHSLEQGITSVVGGQDGMSLAPLAPHAPDLWLPWSGRHRNASWTHMREFLEHLRGRKLGPNFLTLVGYSNLRPPGKRASLKETLFTAERALADQGGAVRSVHGSGSFRAGFLCGRDGQRLSGGRVYSLRSETLAGDAPGTAAASAGAGACSGLKRWLARFPAEERTGRRRPWPPLRGPGART